MFITKKHIPRRTFLRGAGVTLALPLLDSMIPAQTPLAKTAAVRPTRFMGIFVPHGMAPGYWIPGSPRLEPGKMLSIMEPLDKVVDASGNVVHESFLDQTVILSGMWTKSAEPPAGVTGADHWVAAAFMSAKKPKKATGADIMDGITIDQIIAQKIGQESLVPSLQMAIEDPGANSSNCGEGYSCAYTNSISWARPTATSPDGAESADRLREALRRRAGQESGGARRAPGTGPQYSGFRQPEPGPLQAGFARQRPP